MTIHSPAHKVGEWIQAGELEATDPDEKLERLLDEAGATDVSFRHEALCSLRIRRHEAETGDPF